MMKERRIRRAAADGVRAPEVAPDLPAPLESRYGAEIASLFDIVNGISSCLGRWSVAGPGHRSKTWRFCLSRQRVVGWRLPRPAGLGLIEAPRLDARPGSRARPRGSMVAQGKQDGGPPVRARLDIGRGWPSITLGFRS